MKIARNILAASIVAATIVVGGAAGAVPWAGFTADNNNLDPLTDETGFPIFGFNIAYAGNTPAAVKHFVAGLNATQKRSVALGCNQVLRDPDMAGNTTVFQFCRNLRS